MGYLKINSINKLPKTKKVIGWNENNKMMKVRAKVGKDKRSKGNVALLHESERDKDITNAKWLAWLVH